MNDHEGEEIVIDGEDDYGFQGMPPPTPGTTYKTKRKHAEVASDVESDDATKKAKAILDEDKAWRRTQKADADRRCKNKRTCRETYLKQEVDKFIKRTGTSWAKARIVDLIKAERARKPYVDDERAQLRHLIYQLASKGKYASKEPDEDEDDANDPSMELVSELGLRGAIVRLQQQQQQKKKDGHRHHHPETGGKTPPKHRPKDPEDEDDEEATVAAEPAKKQASVVIIAAPAPSPVIGRSQDGPKHIPRKTVPNHQQQPAAPILLTECEEAVIEQDAHHGLFVSTLSKAIAEDEKVLRRINDDVSSLQTSLNEATKTRDDKAAQIAKNREELECANRAYEERISQRKSCAGCHDTCIPGMYYNLTFNCDHVYCCRCLIGYIQHKKSSVPLACPHCADEQKGTAAAAPVPGPNTTAATIPAAARNLLEPIMIDRCVKYSCTTKFYADDVRFRAAVAYVADTFMPIQNGPEFAGEPTKDRKSCPKCNRASYTIANADMHARRCSYCACIFCDSCMVVYHSGISCDKFTADVKRFTDAAAPPSPGIIAEANAKCGACGAAGHHFKYHGCAVCECPACKTKGFKIEFCVHCGGVSKHTAFCTETCSETCSCPICPDCKPGTPCADCDGCPACKK